MNQTSTAKSIMFAIVAMGIVFSVSGLIAGTYNDSLCNTPRKHRNNDNDDDDAAAPELTRQLHSSSLLHRNHQLTQHVDKS